MEKEILIKLLDLPYEKLPKIPIRRYESACYDVFGSWMKQDKELITIGLGFGTELPDNIMGCIVPSKGITNYNLIVQNSHKQIAPDYRGEWIVKFRIINRSFFHRLFGIYRNPIDLNDKKGICQIYFAPIIPVKFKLTNELKETKKVNEAFTDEVIF